MKNIKLIEVKSEIGAGTRGASLGVEALKIAGHDFRSNYFKLYDSITVPDENDLLYEKMGSRHAKRIAGVHKMYEKISSVVSETLMAGDYPIVLSGDHSNAGGTIAGIKMAFPDKKLGVIWVDAHADLHSPYTTPSGNMHGMPLATALGEDNMESAINQPDGETVKYWNKLKNIGGQCPKILYEDLVFFSLRDFEKPEEHLLKKHKVKNFSTSEIRRKGVTKVCMEALRYLSDCDLLYISFDVDSMDPSISKGTGTPVKNGITDTEAANILLHLIQNEKVCCFEVTEINPTLDTENAMAEHAFEILLKVTSQLELN